MERPPGWPARTAKMTPDSLTRGRAMLQIIQLERCGMSSRGEQAHLPSHGITP
ncbi:MAG TPA: hypothetical protein VGH95_00910 [Candidatus Aquirickettsiella sp.]